MMTTTSRYQTGSGSSLRSTFSSPIRSVRNFNLFSFTFVRYRSSDSRSISDGIDGKQARRIGLSGPLGELFDHGLGKALKVFAIILEFN